MDKYTIWHVEYMEDGSITIDIGVDEVKRLLKEGEPAIHNFTTEVINVIKWSTGNGSIKARGSEYRSG